MTSQKQDAGVNSQSAAWTPLHEAIAQGLMGAYGEGLPPCELARRIVDAARTDAGWLPLSLPLNKDRQTLCNDGSCTKPESHIQGAVGCVFNKETDRG